MRSIIQRRPVLVRANLDDTVKMKFSNQKQMDKKSRRHRQVGSRRDPDGRARRQGDQEPLRVGAHL